MKKVEPGNNVLLLQGPMGPFFKRLAAWLVARGASCWKMNFNGGDRFYFSGSNAVDFRGEIEEWPEFLEEFINSFSIDTVFLFGDCREYHVLAREVCQKLGVRVMVFEEGYIRPDYITLEEGGVNDNSSLPRYAEFYHSQPNQKEPRRYPSGFKYRCMALAAVVYYLASSLLRWRYWNYEHHKSLSPLKKGSIWLLSGLRKVLYRSRDREVTSYLSTTLSGNYFLVPLQVYNDSQVVMHSDYRHIQGFINEVLESFAANAPQHLFLVIKHHPMDRGSNHYGAFIRRIARHHGIAQRVIYTHDAHLPTCLDHALGAVMINSTVGLSALLHGTPTKIVGRAIYDMPGLTCQKPLDQFWRNPTPVDRELYLKYRNYLIDKTQLNGSFYGRFPFENE